MYKPFPFLLFTAILIWSIPVLAEEAGEATTITLSRLIDTAMKNNPEILVARKMVEMAKAKVPQAKALPDPMVGAELRNIGVTSLTVGKMDMSMAGMNVSQMIPYPGKRALKAEIVSREANEAEEMLGVTRHSVISRLKTLYYDLAFVEESFDIVDKIQQLLTTFEKTAEAKYSVGEGMQQDVLKAQVEIFMLLERRAMLEQRRQGIGAMLNSLLGQTPDHRLGKPSKIEKTSFPLTIQEAEEIVLKHNPELAAKTWSVKARESEVALMKKEYYPDFTVSAGWKSRGGFDDMYEVMVDVELPFQRERRHYAVQEALAGVGAAEQSREATRLMILSKLKDLYTMARTAEKLSDLYESSIIPQATLSLESAVAGYGVGKVDFLMLLDNVRILLDNQLSYYQQLVEYERAIAQMEELMGGLLGKPESE